MAREPAPQAAVGRRALMGAALALPGAMLWPRAARAGGQLEEPLADAVRSALSAAIANDAPPVPSFASTEARLAYLRWLSRTYTVTTRRVIARSGLVRRTRTEMGHARGYTIAERRGPIQRLWGAGTLTLTNGVDAPLRMVDIPAVRLMNETLADQVEVSQILAHRDSHAIPVVPGPPPPLPSDLA